MSAIVEVAAWLIVLVVGAPLFLLACALVVVLVERAWVVFASIFGRGG